jgi:drug/metabolite transporter (DMT)-like permease
MTDIDATHGHTNADIAELKALRIKSRNYQVRWGFIWALWCAVLWAAWYVPGYAIYYEQPFVDLAQGGNAGNILAAMVVAFLNAIAVLIFMFVWVGTLGKTGEYFRTLRQKRIAFWYLPAGLSGGLAIFGTYVAMVYVGPGFAAVAGLLYPLVGAMLARLWYNERITARAALGLLVLVTGAVLIFLPGLISDLGMEGNSSRWIGYVGGAMAFIGWGLEGAVAGRALDVSDPDVGLTVRFTAEVMIWVVIGVPIAWMLAGDVLWTSMGTALAQIGVWHMLVLMGMTFAFCYVSWYKSFPLIGVGRGQAIAALYGPLSLVYLWIFGGLTPDIWFAVGATVAVIGSFILFTEGRGVLEVIRAGEKG